MTESSETVTWVAFENVGREVDGISIWMLLSGGMLDEMVDIAGHAVHEGRKIVPSLFEQVPDIGEIGLPCG